MNIEEFRDYCLSLAGVSESTPFDENTLVFKVMDKMFALGNMEDFVSINVKCDPEKAIELRENYHAVKPGYHMNKKHWNTISIQADMNTLEIKEWIKHSYNLVVKGLTKKKKEELKYIQESIDSSL